MKQLREPAPRRLLHTREVTCTGYARDDGLWEVDGQLKDVRSQLPQGGSGQAARAPGEPLHWMSLRLTIDDSLQIVAAEAVTHQGPYADCDQINGNYDKLVGLRLEAGFNQAVKARFRGSQGCTHLTEMLSTMATTALQTIRPALERRRQQSADLQTAEPVPASAAAPRLLDTCYALRRDGPVAIVRWGRLAQTPTGEPGAP